MSVFSRFKKKEIIAVQETPIKMLKKNIEAFFKTIRAHDNATVKLLVNSNNEFLKVVREGQPIKDQGQSGLQVALKVANFEIVEFLINKGADLNFTPDVPGQWCLPVLHNCVRAVFHNTHTIEKDKKKFDRALYILELMLKKGANPNCIDSYGNSVLMRALLDAKTFILHPDYSEDLATLEQSRGVFNLLLKHGADLNYSNNKRPQIKEMIQAFGLENYQLI